MGEWASELRSDLCTSDLWPSWFLPKIPVSSNGLWNLSQDRSLSWGLLVSKPGGKKLLCESLLSGCLKFMEGKLLMTLNIYMKGNLLILWVRCWWAVCFKALGTEHGMGLTMPAGIYYFRSRVPLSPCFFFLFLSVYLPFSPPESFSEDGHQVVLIFAIVGNQ